MGLAAYEVEVLADAPVAYWRLDDAAGLPVDSSGAGNNMTAVTGTPIYQSAGAFGAGLGMFLDNQVFFSRPIVTGVFDNFAVEAFIAYRSSPRTNGYAFSQGTPAASNGWQAGLSMARAKQYGVTSNKGFWPDGTPEIPNCTWTMITWVKSGNVAYYVNGAAAGGGAVPAITALSGSCFLNGTALFGSNQTLQAFYSNVSVYATALTAARVAAHWAAVGTLADNPCGGIKLPLLGCGP